MPTTNFLQFNPTLANAQSDATYSADTLRSGGATTAAILSSPLFNKFAYQVSTFIAAFAQMLVNKGYSPSDANFANLVSVLTNVKTSADFPQAVQVVSYASSVTFNAATSAQFDLTLTGNVASSSLINATAGQLLLFLISQDATGGRTFAWPSNVTGPGAICSLPNSISIQMFVVRTGGAIDPITQMLWTTASGLRLGGTGVVSASASGNVSSAYQEIFEKVDASGGAIARTLYSAVGYLGSKVNVKKMDISSNAITIGTSLSQTIDGQTSIQIFRQYDSLTLVSDGANWILV